MWRAAAVLKLFLKVKVFTLALLALSNCSPYSAEALVSKARGTGMTSSNGGFAPLVNASAADLDGTNEYFTCGNITSSDLTNFSVSFWFRPGDTGSAFQGILNLGQTVPGIEWFIGQNSPGTTIWLQVAQSGSNRYGAANVWANTTWTHIVVAYNGDLAAASRTTLYKDGAPVSLTVSGSHSSASITNTTAVLEFNRWTDGTSYAGGVFDEVAIWNGRTLTAGEVVQLYNAGDPTNLRGKGPTIWYRMGDDTLDNFDSGSGSKLLVDQRGGFNCTPVNTDSGDKSSTVP